MSKLTPFDYYFGQMLSTIFDTEFHYYDDAGKRVRALNFCFLVAGECCEMVEARAQRLCNQGMKDMGFGETDNLLLEALKKLVHQIEISGAVDVVGNEVKNLNELINARKVIEEVTRKKGTRDGNGRSD